ncbi:MAG TPA: NfeD family protein [Anaerolineales bacterium]|nr:NfeD family protein [Anaerolineales bacterium]
MELLLDPNIAYLLLVFTVAAILAAIVVPGTGIPETVALFLALLSGYAIYRLGVNLWALGLLLASLVPFFFAVRGPTRGLWLALSIAGMTVGSVFFFPAATGLISVNPILAFVTSALFAALVWIAARKVMQVSQTKPAQELSNLIGKQGETKTSVKDEGSVQVASELWSARSARLIPAGRPVRVVGLDGFVLIVEEAGVRGSSS